MKLWSYIGTVLLCVFISVGYCDVGFGADVGIEEEVEEVLIPSEIELPVASAHVTAGNEHASRTKYSDVINIEGVHVVEDVSNSKSGIRDQSPSDEETMTVAKVLDSVADDPSATFIPEKEEVTVNAAAPIIVSTNFIPEAPVDIPSDVDKPTFDFSAGSGTEALLDQLDEATQEVAALTAANSELTASLVKATDENHGLNNELTTLRAKLTQLYNALTTLQSESQSKSHVSAAQWDQHTKQHAEEIVALTDKLAAAERNASTLEIRARLEKNEKAIARLSTDNCILELEATRHLQQDDLLELQAEIARLKKANDAKCGGVSSTAAGSSLTSNTRTAASTTAASSSSVPSSPQVGLPTGECDASQCVNALLSRYVFFWAAEHHPSDDAAPKATPQARTQPIPSTLPVTATPVVPPSGRVGRSDADLDRVGDEKQGESAVAQVLQLVQRGASGAWQGFALYVHPLVYRMLKYEFQIAAVVARGVYEGAVWSWNNGLSPVLFHTIVPTAQNLYYTQILPFVNASVYPWYKVNLEDSVNSYVSRASAHWIEHYDDWFGYHIADPFEFLVGRLYVAQYFAWKFFASEDLVEQLERVVEYAAGFVPSVIQQLSSMPALQSSFGDHCGAAVSLLVYGSVALVAYLMRRVVLGVVAFVVVTLLSPLLLAVYLFAKVATMFRPRKKSKRSATNSSNSRPSKSLSRGERKSQHISAQQQVGQSDLNSHSAMHSQPPQLATKQLPLNVPLASAAPPGREPSRSVGAVSGRPQSSAQSGGPPRQIYNRMDLGNGGSGSNSAESLSKLGGPPQNTWPGVEP